MKSAFLRRLSPLAGKWRFPPCGTMPCLTMAASPDFKRRCSTCSTKGFRRRQIINRLQRDPQLAEFADYVATFEPRMVEVAIELVAKWGRREGGNLVGPVDGQD